MGAFIGIVLIFGFIACLWIRTWNLNVKPQVESHQRTKMSNFASYNSENFTLTLHRRGVELSNYIKIKNDKDVEISYKPLQVHVGGATVGGVTTGGVYTTGDYHYISGEHKNGLCRLEYTGCLVAKIQLDETLYAKAKESSIKRYLNSNKQIEVIKPDAISTSDLELAYKSLTTTGYVGNKFAKNGYPKYEKCKEIMDWIVTNDDYSIDKQTALDTNKNKKQYKKMEEYRKAGVCQHCGGEFWTCFFDLGSPPGSGRRLFAKICKECKKKKDY